MQRLNTANEIIRLGILVVIVICDRVIHALPHPEHLSLLKTLKSTKAIYRQMRSIIVLTILLLLVLPSMALALSPVEQAYIDGVKEGLKLGQLVNNVDKYNIAVQQLNDYLNQTFIGNASKMWLPKMNPNNNSLPDFSTYSNFKPVHKLDGTPGETTYMQY